jgi:PleD family two-component response regulator
LQDANDDAVTVAFSAGVSYLRPGDQKFENVIARADRALCQVKDQGGNKILMDGYEAESES